MQFAFRWMNCLLMREMSVTCTIRMWDTYLVSLSHMTGPHQWPTGVVRGSLITYLAHGEISVAGGSSYTSLKARTPFRSSIYTSVRRYW
jgi:hypothetical protein